MNEQAPTTERGIHRRHTAPGPRCVGTGRAQMTDICSDVKTLSQTLLLCERRFANALAAGDVDKAGRWAAVGDTLLQALRPQRSEA
jgi:hypothetical protein